MENRTLIREKIIQATLDYIPAEDWSNQALYHGARDAGYDTVTMRDLFPNGIQDLILQWSDDIDRQTLETMTTEDYQACQNTADRIGYLLYQRLQLLEPNREAIRKLLAYLLLPLNTQLGLRLVGAAVDSLWYAVGDKSTDFSYYSKRASVASILMLATVYWLNSYSGSETKLFIARTIQAVMVAGKIRRRLPRNLPKFFKVFSLPLRVLQTFQRRNVHF